MKFIGPCRKNIKFYKENLKYWEDLDEKMIQIVEEKLNFRLKTAYRLWDNSKNIQFQLSFSPNGEISLTKERIWQEGNTIYKGSIFMFIEWLKKIIDKEFDHLLLPPIVSGYFSGTWSAYRYYYPKDYLPLGEKVELNDEIWTIVEDNSGHEDIYSSLDNKDLTLQQLNFHSLAIFPNLF